MIMGAIVKSIIEASNFVFITMEAAGAEIRLMLRKDDPRIAEFNFRQEVTVEFNTGVATVSNLRQIR